MSYFGAVLIILAAYTLWREYSEFLRTQLSACRCYLGAISDYREKIRCFARTPAEWASEYSDKALSDSGFLQALRESGNFAAAYEASGVKQVISGSVDEILRSCFDRLGEGYLDTESEILSAAINKLTREEAKISEAFHKRRKAAGAMLGACACGIVIFIM